MAISIMEKVVVRFTLFFKISESAHNDNRNNTLLI